MLPNADDLPSEAAQLPAHKPVPFPIVGDFGIPEFPVTLGALVALRATVPKAAIYKNNNPLVPKGEIRLAKKRLATPPAGDTELAKDFY